MCLVGRGVGYAYLKNPICVCARGCWDFCGSRKDAPLPPKQHSWGGLFLGVGIGAGSFDYNARTTTDKTKRVEERHCEKFDYYKYECIVWSDWRTKYGPFKKFKEALFGGDDWNGFGTIQIGYDRLLHSHLLIGVFADIDFYPDADHHFTQTWVKKIQGKTVNVGSITSNVSLDKVLSIGGKIGIPVHSHLLLYGIGGFTQASLDGSVGITFNHHAHALASQTISAPDQLTGWFVGGGAKLQLRDNVAIQFEYRFSDFASKSVSTFGRYVSGHYGKKDGKECRDVITRVSTTEFDADIHSVRVALVFSFGSVHHNPPPPLK